MVVALILATLALIVVTIAWGATMDLGAGERPRRDREDRAKARSARIR